MSSPQEWIEATERRIGCKLTQKVKDSITLYVKEDAIRGVNDEDVDGIVRGICQEEEVGETICIPGSEE